MNMNSFTAPPVNNALQPDIYNKLDADVIERTRVANNQLAMRLILEEKIITKYRNEAERIILLEKNRVAKDLNRISQTLPAMARIRDFDEQFFPKGEDSLPRPRNKRKKKSYQTEKSDDVICQRCYIHHMPLKKRFYCKVSPPSSPTVLETSPRNEKTNVVPGNDPDLASVKKSELHPASGSVRSESAKGNFDLEYVDTYRFPDKNVFGRELSGTLAPKLMPNEQWKKVVKNVCSQCLKKERTLAAKFERSRERTVGFDRSASLLSKSRGESKPSTRSSSYIPRSNSHRQTQSRGELPVVSRASSVLKKIPEPGNDDDGHFVGTKKTFSRDFSKAERSNTMASANDSKKILQ